jgi:hypothetical protein
MDFSELATFEVFHDQLAWPWVAIDANRSRFAFLSSNDRVATRAMSNGVIIDGPNFDVPVDFDLRGFSVDPKGLCLAMLSADEVATVDGNGLVKRSSMATLVGEGFVAHASMFDRHGTRLWISLSSETETALLSIDARTHSVFGIVKSAALPAPFVHELHVHPHDDAVLLLAACGQDGTFARVAGWSDGPPIEVPTVLDKGSPSAGFVGFSADSARVHLVEADALRTHAWPSLDELASIALPGHFTSSYSGIVMGDRIVIDGEDPETGEDSVMVYDRSALRGVVANKPVPTGMWVGKLGTDALVTVESKGNPSRGRVIRLPEPKG